MSAPVKPLPPLAVARLEFVGEYAFCGDKLQRKELAERLTGYIDRLREGAVLAIDAPWGEGKSWFGRNWARHLEEQGHKVVFIDSFERDYVEDPFLLIAAEIADALDDGQGAAQSLKQKATGVVKAILPIGTKVLINLAGRLATGTGGLSEQVEDAIESANGDAADAASKWIEKKLVGHAKEKESLENFRVALAKFAKAQDKPVVLFIDELDRCRPDFAIRLIERIKHFFDVPNLVFVLLLNRPQLESAVKGIYGAETDATSYLSKFVNFFFRLRKNVSPDEGARNHAWMYLAHVLDRYSLEDAKQRGGFLSSFSLMANVFNLSLRDIERGVALYAFAQPVPFGSHFLAYVIALKISNLSLFNRLLAGELEAHKEAGKALSAIKDRRAGRGSSSEIVQLSILLEWHIAHASEFKEVGKNLENVRSELWRFNLALENLFPFLAYRIDLPMER